MKIKKAVITAAGYGTRSFPLTKTIQKEMIPILNRPLIDYAVDDLIMGGVEEIIFVVKSGDTQIRHYYSENQEVKAYLQRMDKMDKYPPLEEIYKKAKFTFVEQKPTDQYGTTVPLKLVKDLVKNEDAFFMFMGDNFIINEDGTSESEKMLDLFVKSGASSLTAFIPKPTEVLYKYGVAEIRNENGFDFLVKLIEKPKTGDEPSNLVNLSRYIFTPEIFEVLETQKEDPRYKELFITDTVTIQAQTKDVVVYNSSAIYLDGGVLEEWLKANLLLASKDPALFSEIQRYIEEISN